MLVYIQLSIVNDLHLFTFHHRHEGFTPTTNPPAPCQSGLDCCQEVAVEEFEFEFEWGVYTI